MLSGSHRALLQAILSASYTPYDLREFVKLCYKLALPLVRKKIRAGKLNLQALGTSEGDLMYDCLADLFERDDSGHFVQIKRFFAKESVDVQSSSEHLLLDTLRRIVFGAVAMNLIRLYGDADPTLAKILHNMEVAVTRGNLFRKTVRFGETYLVPKDREQQLQLSPMPFEYLQQEFSRSVFIHDTMPVMLQKLHAILNGQNRYQRAVSVVAAGLLFKKVYALSTEKQEEERSLSENNLASEDVQRTIQKVCMSLRNEMYAGYVGKRKTSEEVFDKYLRAVRRILEDGATMGDRGDKSFFDYLRMEFPQLIKGEYTKKHRTVMEYFVRVAKQRLKEEMSKP